MTRAWLAAATALAALAALPASPARASDIAVGVALPLSGPKKALGEGVLEALQSAVKEINASGGVLGAQIRLVVADDGCQAAEAEAAARALLASAPAVIIGHPCSGAAVAAAPLYRAQGTILIAAGPRHPALTAPKPGSQPAAPGAQTVFRLGGRDDRQGEAAAQWLLKEAPGKRVAMVHDRTAYAREIVETTREALRAGGLAEPLVLPLVAGRADYPDIVAKLKGANAEAVLFAGYPDEATIVVDDLRRAGLAAPVLGSDSLATAEFAQHVAQRGRVEVLMRLEPGDLGDEGPAGPAARRAADGLDIWVQAVRAANSLEPQAVGAELRSQAFETRFLGRVSFNQSGDAREASYVAVRAAQGSWAVSGK